MVDLEELDLVAARPFNYQGKRYGKHEEFPAEEASTEDLIKMIRRGLFHFGYNPKRDMTHGEKIGLAERVRGNAVKVRVEAPEELVEAEEDAPQGDVPADTEEPQDASEGSLNSEPEHELVEQLELGETEEELENPEDAEPVQDLSKLTKHELRELAEDLGIEVPSRINKDEIIALLEEPAGEE